MDNIKLLYIDLFCGAGGTSTGVEHAKLDGTKCARVVACVNHDANAIASHQANLLSSYFQGNSNIELTRRKIKHSPYQSKIRLATDEEKEIHGWSYTLLKE